jgi:hypothetical protein
MYEGPTVRKALVTPRWHLVQNVVPDGTTELYDLSTDPAESRDVASERPSERQALLSRLAAWMDDSAIPPDFAARVAQHVTDSAPPFANRLDAQIGRCLQVLGSSVQPTPSIRGGRIEATLVVRARCPVPSGFRLFVHLRAAAGPFVNADHDFLDGLIPPDRLPVDRYVRDVTQISVPPWFPTGSATLEVGLFQRSERMPVRASPAIAPHDQRSLIAARIEIR